MDSTCVESEVEVLDLAIVDEVISKHGASGAGSLIPVLQKAQEAYGYLSKPVMARIAKGLRIPVSNVYGVVTFYAQFRLKPVGKYIIKVCHGTACHVSGASMLTEAFGRDLCVEDGETTTDRLFTLESVACLGCCSLAPVAMVEDETFGRLDGRKVSRVVKDYRKREASNADQK